MEGRTGYYWTKSDDGDDYARVVRGSGSRNCYNVTGRNGGARPDSLLKESFIDSENRSEKHILSKICQYCKVKEFSSFLIAKRYNLSAMEEYRNTHTSNE